VESRLPLLRVSPSGNIALTVQHGLSCGLTPRPRGRRAARGFHGQDCACGLEFESSQASFKVLDRAQQVSSQHDFEPCGQDSRVFDLLKLRELG